MLIKRNLVFLILVATSLISYRTHSAELKLISIDVMPWAHYDEKTNSFVGIFPDLVRELSHRTGHDIKIKLTPYARVNRELETGRQDCTMLVREDRRSEITILGELVFDLPMGVIPVKRISLDTYDDLYGLKISVLRDLSITEEFTNDTKLLKQLDINYEMGLRKMLHGRLDAIAGAIPTIQSLARENGMNNLLGKPLELSLRPIYLQCSKNSKNLSYVEELNSAIRNIKESSVLTDIVNKYY